MLDPKIHAAPRDLPLILRTEANNQRNLPIDYVLAEDGGRMVHRPEPDISMAELLEEAAGKIDELIAASPAASEDAVEALVLMVDAFLSRNGGSFPMDEVTEEQRLWKRAMKAAYAVVGQPRTRDRDEKLAALSAAVGVKDEPDYFGQLVKRARAAAAKATVKFPQPNYVALKIAEEAGEVVRGAVHYAENRMEWSEVEGEIVQLLAMLIRFVTEGDQINGVTPPTNLISPAPAGETQEAFEASAKVRIPEGMSAAQATQIMREHALQLQAKLDSALTHPAPVSTRGESDG